SARAQVNAGEKPPEANLPFTLTQVATFKLPWRLAFLPDGRMLITEKVGPVWLVTQQGEKTPIGNVPAGLGQGQGGLARGGPAADVRNRPQHLPDVFRAWRRTGHIGPGHGTGATRPVRGQGEPRRPGSAVARHAEGARRTIRSRDRVLARWLPVPH